MNVCSLHDCPTVHCVCARALKETSREESKWDSQETQGREREREREREYGGERPSRKWLRPVPNQSAWHSRKEGPQGDYCGCCRREREEAWTTTEHALLLSSSIRPKFATLAKKGPGLFEGRSRKSTLLDLLASQQVQTPSSSRM